MYTAGIHKNNNNRTDNIYNSINDNNNHLEIM